MDNTYFKESAVFFEKLTGFTLWRPWERGFAVDVEQTSAKYGRMMLGLSPTQASQVVFVMPKPALTTSRERQATDNLDQALSGMLNVLRKPLKLTATLKRRALKNKAAGKIGGPRP